MPKQKINKLNFASQVRTLSLKFYAEQLMTADQRKLYSELITSKDDKDQEKALKLVQQANIAFRTAISQADFKKWFIVSIYHNRDTVRNHDDLFEISKKKGHWHFYAWRIDGKRFRVNTILNMFNIRYDGKKDVSLWDKRGAELIHNKLACVAYALHETKQAILDGKAPYDFDELATNQPIDYIKGMLDAYKVRSKTIKEIDWDEFAETSYRLGLECKDFDKYVQDNLSVTQQTARQLSICRRRYEQGLNLGISQLASKPRLSVLIYGAGNLGKSETSKRALIRMKKKYLNVPRGTGKYDNVSPELDALMFNDVYISDIRNVADNCGAILHRRNSGDRAWMGDTVIATTNDHPILYFAKSMGIKLPFDKDYPDEPITSRFMRLREQDPSAWDAIKATMSRFYVCTVGMGADGNLQLIEEHAQKRGDANAKQVHDDMFNSFRDAFNEEIKDYRPEHMFSSSTADEHNEDDESIDTRLDEPVINAESESEAVAEITKAWFDQASDTSPSKNRNNLKLV